MRSPVAALAVAVVVAVGLAGCAKAPPPDFYMFDPGIREEQLPGFARGVAIGVGPIEVPKHLDRNQIVTRETETKLGLADRVQWAEPVRDGIARVVAVNLAVELDTNRVFILPQRQRRKLDFRVNVFSGRLDGALGTQVVLGARWTISSGDGKKLLHSQVSRVVEPTAGEGFDAYVSAQSRALAIMSREIAGALKGMI